MSTDLSRRAIVAGAASAPALTLPVAAFASTEPDPIFAAIQRWKELDSVEEAAFEARDKDIEACDERYGTLFSAMTKEGRQFFEAKSSRFGKHRMKRATVESTQRAPSSKQCRRHWQACGRKSTLP
jgi:hypothetical protein